MKKSQIIMIVGSLCLLVLFILPMWTITLGAPQYPEPIGMNIWINKITDMNPNDLKNINLMNHYIGMEEIPEYIKEFDYFPIIVLFMSLLGVMFGFLGNRKLYISWFVLMSIIGSVGMYDFWLWEYDYGHNLSESAAIKFVDDLGKPLAYQPPLIGKKVILNFEATSYPALGSYFLFLGMLMTLISFHVSKNKEKLLFRFRDIIYVISLLYPYKKKSLSKSLQIIAFTSIFFSCSIKPKSINFGEDYCNYCMMIIIDTKHASELITKKGKTYVFDSVECMLNNLKEKNNTAYYHFLVNTYDKPIELFDAKKSYFLFSKSISSPMGEYLTAFTSKEKANEFKEKKGGEVYDWNTLISRYNILIN